MPNLVTYLNWTLIFEWFVVSFAWKNAHQKDMCLKEIGLYPSNMLTILVSIVNFIDGIYITN